MNAIVCVQEIGNDSRQLSMTFYKSEREPTPHTAGDIAPSKLSEILAKRKMRPEKSGSAFAQYMLKEGGTRRNVDVVRRSGIECDIDAGATLNDLRFAIDSYWWFAYSTHSHDPENGKFKFRLVIPFCRDISPVEWPHVWQGCNELLGGVLDPATKDISRLVYLPSCPVEKEEYAFHEQHDGALIDPEMLIALAQEAITLDEDPLALNKYVATALKSPPPFELPMEIERVKSMLSVIPADCNREQWRNVIWAVASTGWGCAERLARDWSMTAPTIYVENDFNSDWTSFDPNGGIGFGTLVHHAKHHGWGDVASNEGHSLEWIEITNQRFAWIEDNASIYRLEYADFIEPAKFKTQLDNKLVNVKSGDNTKLVGTGSAWLKHADRRQHRQLVIRPQEGLVTRDNCLNEWKGFAVESAPGNVSPFLELIERLVPDQEGRHYILSWLAHLLHHPEIKMNVSLAFWSLEQGVGKNLLFECISTIVGSSHATVIGQTELAGNFNGWANSKVLIIGDEVSSTDRRQDADKLKGLVTGTTIYINEKYQPAREVQNFVNFIFLSNHHDALFVDDHDRRFFVWEITSGRLPDAMVKKFVTWRDSGGLSALLDYLLAYDVSSFNPKAPAPMTLAKQQMAADNRSDLESWLADLFSSGASQELGREIGTAHEIASRYARDTGNNQPSAKAIVGACKRFGAYASGNQVRLDNGKKVRALALERPEYWKLQPEAAWAAEIQKQIKY
jgi:hypothetical protein